MNVPKPKLNLALTPQKKMMLILASVALVACIGIAAAISYTYQPSNDLPITQTVPTPTPTAAPTATPAPTVVTTTLTADKSTFETGQQLTLIATLSIPQEGIQIAFHEVLAGGALGGPGYATTNAAGVATFQFTPSPVSVDTVRTFRAIPQA